MTNKFVFDGRTYELKSLDEIITAQKSEGIVMIKPFAVDYWPSQDHYLIPKTPSKLPKAYINFKDKCGVKGIPIKEVSVEQFLGKAPHEHSNFSKPFGGSRGIFFNTCTCCDQNYLKVADTMGWCFQGPSYLALSETSLDLSLKHLHKCSRADLIDKIAVYPGN